ncbi:NAD(P)-binding protein [Glonium stellatum]|uniref:NAD(P)-binding protein n=1 Tax=Glonium stellatum TaxID=574774 RepID=A0A8E2FCL8_9PEZI|nr:NAD(P)-binding protein [Glonium stellatum]
MSANAQKYTSKLSNRNVLVFGGTSGIGFCVAEASLEHGAYVTISSSNPARLSNALDRLKSSYPDIPPEKLNGYTCDLADTENVEANLDALLSKVTAGGEKKLDHISFTAGDALTATTIANATPTTIKKAMNVRFIGPIMIAKLIPKYMNLTPASSFTITSGSITHKPAPGWAILAGWGGALEGLMRGLAVDLKPMRVNMVSPGAVETELFETLSPEVREMIMKNSAAQTTVGLIGKPENTAEAYLYAMKDQFATGGIIETNGGRYLV